MAWAKVDDGWWCHPKVIGLSAAARGVWISALSWSCAQRKDVVPSGLLPMVGGSNDEANELLGVGLWVEHPDGYRIHDWAEYQDMSLSEKRAEAGRKGGKASGETRRASDQGKQSDGEANEANDRSNGEANAEAGTHPGPTRPNPTPPEDTHTGADLTLVAEDMATSSPGSEDEVEFDRSFWKPYPPRNGKKLNKGGTFGLWRRLDPKSRRMVALAVQHYAAAVRDGLTIAKDPERFIKGDYWRDWLQAAVPDRQPTEGAKGESEFGEPMEYRRGAWYILRDTGRVPATKPPVRLAS